MKKSIFTLINEYRPEIMGVAALWVFLFHERGVLGSGTGAVYTAIRFFLGTGFCGVDIFLFLSGIGLTYAIEKYPVKEFYKRRFARVLPAYVLTVVIAMFLRKWDVGFFLKTLIGYNFWMRDMYTLLWFAYAILTLYLVFPLYYRGMKRFRSPLVFTLGVLIVWYAASVALDGTMRADLYGFTNRIPVFLVGVLCGRLAKEKPIVFSKVVWALCLLVLGLGFVCSFLVRYKGVYLLVPDSTCFLPTFLIAVSGVCLLAQMFSLLAAHGGKLGMGIRKTVAFYGKMSFEFYCMQELLGENYQFPLVETGDVVAALVVLVFMTVMAYVLQLVCKKISVVLIK